MKYIFVSLLISLHASVNGWAQCPPKVLHFADNFSEVELSPAVWRDNSFAWSKMRTRTWSISGNHAWRASELQYYTQYDDPAENPENNYVLTYDAEAESDILNLAVSNTPLLARLNHSWPPNAILEDGGMNERIWEYTAGALVSMKRFKYGMYVMRAKFTAGQHLWPAFWLFGPGEGADEIDIIEFEGHRPMESPSNYHWLVRDQYGNPVLDANGNFQYGGDGDHIPLPFSLAEGYHNIGLIWLPVDQGIDILHFYVDDMVTLSRIAFHDFNATMALNLNHALGGSPSIADYDDTTIPYSLDVSNLTFPVDFKIDHVKVYEPFECEEITVCDYGENPATSEALDPVITGSKVTIGGSGCVFNVTGVFPNGWYGKHVDVIASEEIVIKDGFHAEPGCNFRAWTSLEEEGDGKDEDPLDALLADAHSLRDSLADLLAAEPNISLQEVNSQLLERTKTQLDQREVADFSVYPNPNSGTFVITGSEMSRIRVYDAAGKLVENFRPVGNAIEIDGLSAGLYLVQVQMADGSVESAKVVVQ